MGHSNYPLRLCGLKRHAGERITFLLVSKPTKLLEKQFSYSPSMTLFGLGEGSL